MNTSIGGFSSADEDDMPSSPGGTRTMPLSAISEQEDFGGSGSDSDMSATAMQPGQAGPGGLTSNTATGAGGLPRKMEQQLRLSRESTRLSESLALKSGYLMKKGERRKAWQKRWFVLRGGQVAMYKSDKVSDQEEAYALA